MRKAKTPSPYLAGLGLLLGLGYLFEKRAGRDAYARFQPAARRVDIGGRRMYAVVQGERRPGQPLVVLESGHADWSPCWAQVIPEVARFARVLAYDRAGAGWSDPAPAPRTPERIVHDLHRLLKCSGEEGPYLLVGHSMGGPLTRLFYHFYPAEVAGMVWVDSAHEYFSRFVPFWDAAAAGFLAFLQLGRALARVGLVRLLGQPLLAQAYAAARQPADRAELLTQVSGPRFFDWLSDETLAFLQPYNWANTPLTLGDLPVISLEAQYPSPPPPGIPPLLWTQYLRGWWAALARLSRLSTRLRRVPVQTGHVVMFEDPQVVIRSIREMLAECTPGD